MFFVLHCSAVQCNVTRRTHCNVTCTYKIMFVQVYWETGKSQEEVSFKIAWHVRNQISYIYIKYVFIQIYLYLHFVNIPKIQGSQGILWSFPWPPFTTGITTSSGRLPIKQRVALLMSGVSHCPTQNSWIIALYSDRQILRTKKKFKKKTHT